MLRVWIAEKKLHCSMKVGMYLEAMNISEEMAWGVILADATRHIANALESGYSESRDVSIEKLKNRILKSLRKRPQMPLAILCSLFLLGMT